MKGKHKRKVNRTTRARAIEFLSIVSSDVGNLFPPTIYGEIFYSLFQEDATGAIQVHLMKSKGEVSVKYRQFRAQAENPSGRKLKVLRGDNGGEYTSTAFKNELKETGDEWQVRSPYIREQNWKAERQNYTSRTMVRSIMAAQLLPRVLQGEILKTSVYLKNRSLGPYPETPFKRLHHKKPNLDHLRMVGAKWKSSMSRDKGTTPWWMTKLKIENFS